MLRHVAKYGVNLTFWIILLKILIEILELIQTKRGDSDYHVEVEKVFGEAGSENEPGSDG